MANVKGGAVKDQLALDVALDGFRKLRARGLGIPEGSVAVTARRAGCSIRTVYRRLAETPPKARSTVRLTPDQLAHVWLSRPQQGEDSIKKKPVRGNLHLAWEQLRNAGAFPQSYRTFVRAFHRLDRAVQRGLLEGSDAMRALLPYLELAKPSHFLEIVESDHTLLEYLTLYDPVTKRQGHPWLTVVIDVWSRMVLGFSVTLPAEGASANAESVFVALADAILTYGKFGTLRFDQGREYMHPVAEALVRLGIGAAPCPAYRGWTKPYVERFNRTLKHTLLPAIAAAGYEIAEQDEEAV
jgi:transposase InsO family protein